MAILLTLQQWELLSPFCSPVYNTTYVDLANSKRKCCALGGFLIELWSRVYNLSQKRWLVCCSLHVLGNKSSALRKRVVANSITLLVIFSALAVMLYWKLRILIGLLATTSVFIACFSKNLQRQSTVHSSLL